MQTDDRTDLVLTITRYLWDIAANFPGDDGDWERTSVGKKIARRSLARLRARLAD
jgi:hypothetical protein